MAEAGSADVSQPLLSGHKTVTVPSTWSVYSEHKNDTDEGPISSVVCEHGAPECRLQAGDAWWHAVLVPPSSRPVPETSLWIGAREHQP